MSKSIDVLFVDDEEHLRRAMQQTLELAGYKVITAPGANEAMALVSRDFSGIIVTDIRMPGLSGMDLLQLCLEIDADLPVIFVTGHGDITLAVEAMRAGAYDFIEKPFSSEQLLDPVARALEKRRLTLEVRHLRDAVTSRRDNLELRLAGRSAAMVRVREQIRAIAPSSANVLIVGDAGTGKEVVARAIHDLGYNLGAAGNRGGEGTGEETRRPFVPINCSALPTEMIEAELFGYEAGAFPGAVRARFGKFEHARNGTIFFDGIETLPPEVQAKLVPVLEQQSITRLGSNEAVRLNVRFIASSKLGLEEGVEKGWFRADLLYQVSVATISIPDLAHRREDIGRLFVELARDAAARNKLPQPEISEEYLALLAARNWPGNIRELRNVAERYVLGIQKGDRGSSSDGTRLADRVASFERQLICSELSAKKGRLKDVYLSLGLSRKSLYEKMLKYGIERKDFL
ncbi:MAG TPA: sigma-54-dependent Fis family transcriptional regulator [Devosia sp.]|nr:sigma-54-dependent Fis family transcriptional regulator [Devosia sp.]